MLTSRIQNKLTFLLKITIVPITPIILVIFWLFLMLRPNHAFAVGLGELKIESFIDQKLNAQLQLVGEWQNDAKNIQLNFEILGAEENYNIQYKIEKKMVRIYTAQSFMEDILNLQITIIENDNKITKKYKKIMDIDPKLLNLAKKQTVVEVASPINSVNSKNLTEPSDSSDSSDSSNSSEFGSSKSSDNNHTQQKTTAPPLRKNKNTQSQPAAEPEKIVIKKEGSTKKFKEAPKEEGIEKNLTLAPAYENQPKSTTDYLDIQSSVNFSGLTLPDSRYHQKNMIPEYQKQQANLLRLHLQKQNLLNQLNMMNKADILSISSASGVVISGTSTRPLNSAVVEKNLLITTSTSNQNLGFWQKQGQHIDVLLVKYHNSKLKWLQILAFTALISICFLGLAWSALRYRAEKKRQAIKKRLDMMVKELNQLKSLSDMNQDWLTKLSRKK